MAIIDIRPGLRTFLLADSGISTAVGGSRVYPVNLPQGTTSQSIVLTRISALGDPIMSGPSGLLRTRYQVDCWATTQDGAASLADLVKFRLDGYHGAMGSVTVQGVFFDSEREDYDPDAKLHRVSRDYIVAFEER